MSSTLLFSIVLPAYQAHETIARALISVEGCGLSQEMYEVIIAPDDGRGYPICSPSRMAIRQLEPIAVRIGAGPARNRAIAAARGAFIAFLDADDTWEPGYLSAALPLVLQGGIAFSTTSIIEDEKEILRLAGHAGTIDLADMAESGASFFPVVRRSQAGPFRSGPSQDVLHSVELVALHGGRCPVMSVAYQHRVNALSTTMAGDFSIWAALAYERYIEEIISGRTRVPHHLRAAAADVFRSKLRLNHGYQRLKDTGLTYYEVIASRLSQASGQLAPSRLRHAGLDDDGR